MEERRSTEFKLRPDQDGGIPWVFWVVLAALAIAVALWLILR